VYNSGVTISGNGLRKPKSEKSFDFRETVRKPSLTQPGNYPFRRNFKSMNSALKKSLLAIGALAGTVAATVSSASAAFTGTFSNAMTTEQTTALNGVADASLDGIIDFFYTGVIYILGFITQPAVIGVLVAMGLMGWVYSKIRARWSGL